MEKEIKTRVIQSHKDLVNSKKGDFILIDGRNELVVNLNDKDFQHLKVSLDSIITLSSEGNYLVLNHYYSKYVQNSISNDDSSYLEPFIKNYCKKGSFNNLDGALQELAYKFSNGVVWW